MSNMQMMKYCLLCFSVSVWSQHLRIYTDIFLLRCASSRLLHLIAQAAYHMLIS